MGAEEGSVAAVLDPEVLLSAQAGDAAALSAVYRDLAPSVLGYLSARGVPDPEAQVSEIFITVLSKLPTLTGGMEGLRTFTFSVAHARLVDDRRRRARRPEQVPYVAEWDERTSVSAEQQALEHDDEARARKLLATLPPDQAEVLTLRVLADLSIDQTAIVVGRSPGAVKQLQRRALVNLRARMAAQGVTK
ncbi:MAG: hypothetical protein QOD87_2082 [Pseudonocardiales bacterium]|jgi:RNA polymerase sigma factor (sigma-70 family)|nr:hypothetical protein [Pseudonocardiales bacterium]